VPKEFIAPTNVFESRSMGFSQAIKAGNMLFFSGAMPCDENFKLVGEGNFVAQTKQALENVKRTLVAAGASMRDIVKLNWYVTHIGNGEDFEKAAPVRDEYFGDWVPAATLVEVPSLFLPGQLLEVDVIAVIG